MKIYAEYLFLENFIVGLGVLYLTSVITGLTVKKAFLFFGGVLCGLFAFTIFLPDWGYLGILVRNGAFSAFLVLVCLGKRGFFKALLTFWIVSLVLGAAALCLFFATGSYGVIGAGALYMDGMTYLKAALGFAAGYTSVRVFSLFLHKKLKDEKLIKDVCLKICGMDFRLCGYVDTGNSLTEPLSGAAALIISEREMERIKRTVGEENMQTRYCVVPYKSAGVDSGMLSAFRLDSVEIEGKPYPQEAVVAVYEGEFKYCGGCNLLLGREFIEGGLV